MEGRREEKYAEQRQHAVDHGGAPWRASDSPRSQTPVWEHPVLETLFRIAARTGNGVSKTGAFPNRSLGTRKAVLCSSPLAPREASVPLAEREGYVPIPPN